MTPSPQDPIVVSQKLRITGTQLESEMSQTQDGESVVISGMSGLYPQSHNVKELAKVLYDKV